MAQRSANGTLLVSLCFVCGCGPTSIRVACSRLFGMDVFDMGLPKYLIDKIRRHRLWLTVILRNIPQIIIAVLYARILIGFVPVVMYTLTSSSFSLLFAMFTAMVEYPKHYYTYQIRIWLSVDNNVGYHATKFDDALRFTNTFAKAIRDSGHDSTKTCYVNKIFKYTYNNDSKSFLFNVTFDERLDFVSEEMCQAMMTGIDDNPMIKRGMDLNYARMRWEYVDHKMLKSISLGFVKNTKQQKEDRMDDGDDVIEIEYIRAYNDSMYGDGDYNNYNVRYNYNHNELQKQHHSGMVFSSDLRAMSTHYPSDSAYLKLFGKSRKYRHLSTKELTRLAVNASGEWSTWTEKEISAWINKILIERFDARNETTISEINNFMNKFDDLSVTVECIEKLNQDDDFLRSFKHHFNDIEKLADWEISIWPTFESAINELLSQGSRDCNIEHVGETVNENKCDSLFGYENKNQEMVPLKTKNIDDDNSKLWNSMVAGKIRFAIREANNQIDNMNQDDKLMHAEMVDKLQNILNKHEDKSAQENDLLFKLYLDVQDCDTQHVGSKLLSALNGMRSYLAKLC